MRAAGGGRRRRGRLGAQPGGRRLASGQGGGRAQVVKPHRAAGIAPMRGEKPRLGREQRERVALGPWRRQGLGHVAGVGVETCGHIQRQHAGGAGMHVRQPAGHAPFGRAGSAYAQQRVHAQVLRAQPGRRLIRKEHASGARALQRAARIGRQALFFAQPAHHRAHAPGVQMHGGFQPVAAVIARAASQPDHARMRRQRQRQPRGSQPRALHERVRRKDLHGRMLHPARGSHAVKRQRSLAGDAEHEISGSKAAKA